MSDLNARFEKISDRAKAATDELRAAGRENRDQLETNVANARDRATAATDHLRAKADAAATTRRRSGERVRAGCD
jgi:hypothetical protein